MPWMVYHHSVTHPAAPQNPPMHDHPLVRREVSRARAPRAPGHDSKTTIPFFFPRRLTTTHDACSTMTAVAGQTADD